MANINQRLDGLSPLSYLGVNAVQPPDFVTKNRPPTINDSQNFMLGTIWLDMTGYPGTLPTANSIYMLVALVSNVATWVPFGGVNAVTAGENLNNSGTSAAPIVNLNRIIRWPNTTIDGLQGALYFGATCTANICTGGTLWLHNYGTNNTFVGSNAGNLTLTTGAALNNTAIGIFAGNALTTGNSNTLLGQGSGVIISSGSDNTFIGSNSGSASFIAGTTTGSQNTAVGNDTLWQCPAGSFNLALGNGAGASLTTNDSNNILINHAGVPGKSGLVAVSVPGGNSFINNYGIANTFIGDSSGNFTLTSTGCTGLGFGTLTLLSSSINNTAVGLSALSRVATGSGGNVALGAASGSFITTGQKNVLLGLNAGQNYVAAESSNIIIGSDVLGTVSESNVCRIGVSTGAGPAALAKTFIAGIRGITTDANDAVAVLISSTGQLGTVSSSERYKDNIESMGSYSDVLRNLRPVLFNYKSHSPASKSVGLIAEEVVLVAPQLVVYDQDGLPETVKYNDLVPMLLNELQKVQLNLLNSNLLIDELIKRIEILESK